MGIRGLRAPSGSPFEGRYIFCCCGKFEEWVNRSADPLYVTFKLAMAHAILMLKASVGMEPYMITTPPVGVRSPAKLQKILEKWASCRKIY